MKSDISYDASMVVKTKGKCPKCGNNEFKVYINYCSCDVGCCCCYGCSCDIKCTRCGWMVTNVPTCNPDTILVKYPYEIENV